jgi:hypothetical protein
MAIAISGCGSSSGGGGTSDARTELEGIIRMQLPDKVKQNIGTAVYVQSVQCTKAGGNTYDCIATVRGSDATGHLISQDVGIDGTCDDRGCVWQARQ